MQLSLEPLWSGFRSGIRLIRTAPGFAAVVVLTLALGIGANAAAFSLVYAVLLRPVGFVQPERLVFISTGQRGQDNFDGGVSAAELDEWRPELAELFDDFAIVGGNRQSTWAIAGQAAHVADRDASTNFFTLLGVHPIAGRIFTEADSAGGGGDVVLLSYQFWRRYFQGDLRAVGRRLTKNGGTYPSYEIIGILPASFVFDESTDLWMPQPPLPASLRDIRTVRRSRLVARLKPGRTISYASRAMELVAAREEEAHPASNRNWRVRIVPLTERLRGRNGRTALLLWAAVSCLLFITCANMANLLLARADVRRPEIGLRLALGASRGQIVLHLLAEIGVLALTGAVSGWLAAVVFLRLIGVWASSILPPAISNGLMIMRADALDPAVVVFTTVISITALVAFGLIPAWQTTQVDLNGVLEGSTGRRSTRRGGFSRVLVAAELVVVMILVVDSGLFIRSFSTLAHVETGFETANRLTFDVELARLPGTAYASHPRTQAEVRIESQQQGQWLAELERRLRSLPGVVEVGASDSFPLVAEGGGWGSTIEGRVLPATTSMAHVTAGYFDAIGAPIVQGTNFRDSRRSSPDSKDLIINQTMAQLLFPDGLSVGKHVRAPRCEVMTSDGRRTRDCLVIGVARDTRLRLDTAPPPMLYFSLHQDTPDRVTFVIHTTRNNAMSLAPAVRATVRTMPAVGPGKPYLLNVQTLSHLISEGVGDAQFRSWSVSLFAGFALFLATLGAYGVQAHDMNHRRHEVAVRIALGARPATLLGVLLCRAGLWTLLGILGGLLGSLVSTRLIASFLFGISQRDPFTFLVSPLVLFVASMLAAFLPARRMLRADPMVSLRRE